MKMGPNITSTNATVPVAPELEVGYGRKASATGQKEVSPTVSLNQGAEQELLPMVEQMLLSMQKVQTGAVSDAFVGLADKHAWQSPFHRAQPSISSPSAKVRLTNSDTTTNSRQRCVRVGMRLARLERSASLGIDAEVEVPHTVAVVD